MLDQIKYIFLWITSQLGKSKRSYLSVHIEQSRKSEFKILESFMNMRLFLVLIFCECNQLLERPIILSCGERLKNIFQLCCPSCPFNENIKKISKIPVVPGLSGNLLFVVLILTKAKNNTLSMTMVTENYTSHSSRLRSALLDVFCLTAPRSVDRVN